MSKRHSPLDISVAAAETIARRLPLIWWQFWQPTASGRAEMIKMVAEKQMAFAEACFGLQIEALKAAMTPWWMATPNRHAEATQSMVQAALAPAARRTRANALRLRRR